MKLYHYILFLLLKEIFSSNNKIYKIPFGLFKQQNSEKEEERNIINNIIDNRKYLNLSIGTPTQLTPLELDSNSQTFSISNNFFNKNESSTYEQISKNEEYFIYDTSENGYNSKDILNINNTKKEINFILGTKYQNKKGNNLGIS